jgi:histidinol-phosphate aminotransferase
MSDKSSSSIFSLARPEVAAMEAYTPGIQPRDSGWIKLNTNENPYPPSPAVHEAIRNALGADASSLRLYPDPQSSGVRSAIAKYHGVDASNICVGNGSDDILNLLIRVFGGSDRAVGSITPSYSLYQKLVEAQGAPWIEIPFTEDFSLPLEKAASCGANLLFLTSPNAPTGVGFTLDQVAELATRYQGILAIDETYIQFGGTSALTLQQRFPHIVITRSFSKAYGLAGLRLGYAIASNEVISLLDRVRDSYNVNRLSQVAAIAAIEDKAYYEQIFSKIVHTREEFSAWLRGLGWFTYPSQSNFVFTRPADKNGQHSAEVAHSCYRYLLDQKILVRYFGQHKLTSSFLRISIGTAQEMKKTMNAIESWL